MPPRLEMEALLASWRAAEQRLDAQRADGHETASTEAEIASLRLRHRQLFDAGIVRNLRSLDDL